MKQKKLWCALSLLLSAAMLLNFAGCAATTPPAASNGTNAQTEPGTSNTLNAPVVKMASVNLMADVKQDREWGRILSSVHALPDRAWCRNLPQE